VETEKGKGKGKARSKTNATPTLSRIHFSSLLFSFLRPDEDDCSRGAVATDEATTTTKAARDGGGDERGEV